MFFTSGEFHFLFLPLVLAGFVPLEPEGLFPFCCQTRGEASAR